MLVVEQHPIDKDILIIKFNYYYQYIRRIKTIPGATFKKDLKCWLIPLGALDYLELEFLGELVYKTPRWVITNEPPPDYSKMYQVPNIQLPNLKLPLKDYQSFGVKFIVDRLLTNNFCILADDVGLGKALANTTNVLTTNGWKQISSLTLNDMVFAEDGKSYNVLGVYPQGARQTYKVIFSDDTEVICDGEHLWTYQTANMRTRKQGYKTDTLNNIMKLPLYYQKKDHKAWNIYIPMTEPVQLQEHKVDIDPYILGLLIGDGGFTSNSIRFSNTELDIIQSVSNWCINEGLLLKNQDTTGTTNKDFRIIDIDYKNQGVNRLTRIMKKLNLYGKLSQDKFIPDEYLYNSVDNRIALLSGLIDTDGEVVESWYIYSSTSERLINQIKFLVESLGGTATLADRQTQFTYNGDKKAGQPSYRLNIKMPNDITPFRSMKHSKKHKKGQTCARRTIREIVPYTQEECTCISVSSPNKLFLIDSFIPTHNTPQALVTMDYFRNNQQISKVLLVCKKSLKIQWQRDGFNKFLYGWSTMIVDGDKKRRKAIYKEFNALKDGALITNYHTIMNDYAEIKQLGFNMVCIDEAQKVSTRTGVINKAITEVCSEPSNKYTLFLTGTPIMSTPEDIYGILQITGKDIFGPWTAFAKRHIVYDETSKFYSIVGYKDLNILRTRIQDTIIRRTEYEVDVELPEQNTERIDVNTDEVQDKLLSAIKCSSMELMGALDVVKDAAKKEMINNQLKAMGAANQAAANDPRLFLMSKSKMMVETFGSMIPKTYKMSPKTEALIELLQTIIDGGHKAIVFTKFERAVRMLADDIQKALKITTVTYSGQIDDFTRDANMQAFWNDPDVKVFVMNDAGAEGLNAQIAKFIINYDQPDTPGLKVQRFGRVRRLGSNHKHVYMYDLITLGTKDESKIDELEQKQNLFEGVVGLDKEQSKAIKEAMK